MRSTFWPLVGAVLLLAGPLARAADYPVTIANCGATTTLTQPPSRAVAMNQAATEIMLALGLQDRMVGTAYLDDTILPAFAGAYRKIPVLAEKYPSREVLLGARPDFVYAAYSSAFAQAAGGPRAELSKLGIETYVSPSACTNKTRPPGVTFETTFGEIRDVGRIFGVSAKAEALIAGYQAELKTVREKIGTVATPPRVFWYDNGSPPSVGACCNAPNEILRLVGAENIFADTPGSWTTVSWEKVVERNPDVIVLVNASWATADEKRKLLTTEKAYSSIEAVKRQRFVTIDFSLTTPGIRNVAAVRTLATALYPDRFK